MSRSTERSWALYEESLRYLAHGSSTGSKIPTLRGSEPAAVVRGKGCRVWDADGNEYIDFRNALGPVTLGYAVPEINAAIAAQLEDGIVFGHPHPLEGEVARLLVEKIPCAQRVRFLKTGGEAIAACIRIARHATGRDLIFQCGYNGWLNRMSDGGRAPVGVAGARFESGVPAALRACHRSLPWGESEAWKKAFEECKGAVAAVVIASDYREIEKGSEFLPALRRLTRDHGALMIMDEIVTGFRLAVGGAHEYFRFDPDLAVFAKGIANGMPLSAYLGRADLLDSTRGLGITSTYGGEALSLAAARAAIRFYAEHGVIAHLWRVGRRFLEGVNRLFEKHAFPAALRGLPVCPVFVFQGEGKAGEFFRSCYAHGVSLYDAPFVNYSHKEADIDEALERMEEGVRKL